MDLNTLTIEELAQLLRDATDVLNTKRAQAQADNDERREQITTAITNLEALLGPEGATPGTDSIREVLAYDDATIVANSGIAFRLILLGMESLTATTLDVARVVGK